MKKNRSASYCQAIILSLLSASLLISSCKEKDADVIKPKTIADIILEDNDFTIFREIVLYSKITDGLRTENLTLFAPNDAAFQKSHISSSIVITSLPQDSILSFIQNHLLNKNVSFDDIKIGNMKAMNGHLLTVSLKQNIKVINDSNIIEKNIKADNGVIHVIDRLLTDD